MCEFDKKRHMAQNPSIYLNAANKGVPPEKVFAQMMAARIIWTVIAGVVVSVVVGLLVGSCE